jgi:uncharacterized membrane protein
MLIVWNTSGGGSSHSSLRQRLGRGVVFGLSAGFFYGISSVLVKLGLGGGGSPVAGTFISYLGASAILAATLAQGERRGSLGSINRSAILWFGLAGFFVAAAQMLRYVALSLSPVSVIAPLSSTTPLLVILFSFLLNRSVESFRPQVILGAMTVVSGIILLLSAG